METEEKIKSEKYDSEEDIVITHTDIPIIRDENCLTTSKCSNESANIFDRLNDMQAAMTRDEAENPKTSDPEMDSKTVQEITNSKDDIESTALPHTHSSHSIEPMEIDPPVLEPEDDVIINDVALLKLSNNINCKAEIITDNDGNKVYKCLMCCQTFNYYSNIARHRLRHTRQTNSLQKCWYCDQVFQKQLALREHVRRVHGRLDVYECSACLRRFRYKGYLASHAYNCTGKFPYECLFCSQKLSTYNELTKHSHNHYTCMFCDNRYNDLYSLENHEKTHAIEDVAIHQTVINNNNNKSGVNGNKEQIAKPSLQPIIKEYRSIAKTNQLKSKDENPLPPCITDDWISGLSASDSYKKKTIARIKARSRFYSNRPNNAQVTLNKKTINTLQMNKPGLIQINKSPTAVTGNPIVLPTVNSSSISNGSAAEQLTFLLITTDLNSGHILLQPLEIVPQNSASSNEIQTHHSPESTQISVNSTTSLNSTPTKFRKSTSRAKIMDTNKVYSRPWNMTNILNIRLLTQVIKPNGILVYACHCCSEEFQNIEDLKIHNCNIPKRTTCRFCGIQISRVSLLGHENRHLGVRQFKCDMCYRGFTTDQILKRHIKDVHNSSYSYCAFCKGIFAKAANLENHLLECTRRNSLTSGTIWDSYDTQNSLNTIDLTDD